MVFITVIGVIASIVLTVFLCAKVLPEKYNGTFQKKILQTAHDYFNFKKLYIESVLKALFTFLSITCVVVGVLGATVGNFIQFFGNIADAITYDYFGNWIWTSLFRNFFVGVGLAVLAPIVLRLVYEGTMMFILLVKNVISINNKLKGDSAEEEE